MPRRKRETKDEQIEQRDGEAEQAPLLNPDRLLHYVNTFKGYLAKKETIMGHYRNARKAAKAEGLNPSRIDEAIALERGDPDEFRRQYEDTAQVLKIMGAPFQLAIFDTRYGDPVKQAEAEGRAAGKAGRVMDCRWPEGSEAETAYKEAYARAQADHVPGAREADQNEIEDAIQDAIPANNDRAQHAQA